MSKPVCPKCYTSNSYYRLRTDDFVCRNCGSKHKEGKVVVSKAKS